MKTKSLFLVVAIIIALLVNADAVNAAPNAQSYTVASLWRGYTRCDSECYFTFQISAWHTTALSQGTYLTLNGKLIPVPINQPFSLFVPTGSVVHITGSNTFMHSEFSNSPKAALRFGSVLYMPLTAR